MIFHSKLPEGIYKILHMPSSSLLGQITRSEFLFYEIFQVKVSTRRLHGENQMQKQQNESQFQLLLEKLGVATPPRLPKMADFGVGDLILGAPYTQYIPF